MQRPKTPGSGSSYLTPRTVRILCLVALLGTFAGAMTLAQAQNGDDADFKKEERFHKIYKTYNEQPTSNEAWEKALANRKANTYPIQKDDTLWDISSTFFGDSSYWPKIWSYNTDNILNPHEISPKNVIKFYPGTMAEAPTIGLADAKAAPDEMPSKIIEKTPDGGIEGIKIPPPKKVSRPLVKHLPKSLPIYRLGRVNTPPADFESDSLIKKIPVPVKNLSRYVTEGAVNSVGEVSEVELLSGETAADFQYIIVRLTDPSQKHLVAYKDETKISDASGNGGTATVVQILGEIEVQEKVSDSENLYRALVTKIVDPVELGSKLMVGKIQTFTADATSVTSSLQAKIIGGENQRYTHNMFSDDTLVFLNAGSKQGIQVNASLPIFKNERLRNETTLAKINDRTVGTLKVVKVSENFSTGYILNATSELIVGDYVGGRPVAGGVSGGASGGTSANSSSSSDFDSSDDQASSAGALSEDGDALSQDTGPSLDEAPSNTESPEAGSGDDADLQL